MSNNPTLNAQQSIQIINNMLQRHKENLERSIIKPFLAWGYTTVLTSIAVYALLPTMGANAHYLWLAIPLIGAIFSLLSKKSSSTKEEGSHLLGKFMGILWAVLGINCFISSFLATPLVLTIVTTIIGSGAIITAFTFNIQVLKATSIIATLLGYSLVSLHLGSYEILIFGLAFFIMLVLPGHYLQLKKRNEDGRERENA